MNTNTNLFFNYFSLRMPFKTFLDTLIVLFNYKSSDKHARGCSLPSNSETTSNFLTFKHLPTYKILSGLPNCFQKDLMQLGTFALGNSQEQRAPKIHFRTPKTVTLIQFLSPIYSTTEIRVLLFQTAQNFQAMLLSTFHLQTYINVFQSACFFLFPALLPLPSSLVFQRLDFFMLNS